MISRVLATVEGSERELLARLFPGRLPAAFMGQAQTPAALEVKFLSHLLALG